MLVVFRLSATTLINSLNNILLMQYINTIQMAITSGMTVNNNILLQNEQLFLQRPSNSDITEITDKADRCRRVTVVTAITDRTTHKQTTCSDEIL